MLDFKSLWFWISESEYQGKVEMGSPALSLDRAFTPSSILSEDNKAKEDKSLLMQDTWMTQENHGQQ